MTSKLDQMHAVTQMDETELDPSHAIAGVMAALRDVLAAMIAVYPPQQRQGLEDFVLRTMKYHNKELVKIEELHSVGDDTEMKKQVPLVACVLLASIYDRLDRIKVVKVERAEKKEDK